MTQEEKQLLLKDLCGRLPYGVQCSCTWSHEVPNGTTGCVQELSTFLIDEIEIMDNPEYDCQICDVKPYLRPMSSMTEEEKKELKQEHVKDEKLYAECLARAAKGDNSLRGKVIIHYAADWCDKNHFDYRGLIPMGLALEAPEGMYNKEESEKGGEIPTPKTVDESVKTLAKIVSKEDRDYILENGAISVHDSLGRWIRNEWGLWTGSKLKNELKKKGFEHPDDMSNYIIEEFIKYWNNKI
jgi:hypothetical protein